MNKSKQIHFYGKVIRNKPSVVPWMAARRLIEALSRAPQGLVDTQFRDVVFPVDMNVHAITRKYFYQTHEMFLEDIFRTHLKPGATFIDIGANLGYWSAFATSLVGKSGEVHAFEPVPQFFRSVERLSHRNPSYKIVANNVAVGAGAGRVDMQVVKPTTENYDNFDTNIGSSSALPGFLDHDRQLTETIAIDVVSLDDYLAEKRIDLDRIGLIKIDVEGFESYCFDGMKSVLRKTGRKIPILCEILTDPERHALLDGPKIIERLRSHGYTCLDATTNRPIDLSKPLNFEENIICV